MPGVFTFLRGTRRFWLDTYRFCKLIRDTIKSAVDIGFGSGARDMRFIRMSRARHYGRPNGWQMRHAFRLLAG